MPDDRRSESPQQRCRSPERKPDARQHDDEADVSGATDRVDMCHAEQQRLRDDGRHQPDTAVQASEYHAAEDHLLDDRCGDHSREDDRDDVGPIDRGIADRLGVARHRNAERDHHEGGGHLGCNSCEPDDGAPAQVGPP